MKMFNILYKEMVHAGVAEKREEPVFLDEFGNIVIDETKAYGRRSTHKVTHPQKLFMFDETGGNTNMKNDGHYGGTKYLSKRGQCVKMMASEVENHFTTLTVTALTGEADLCVVILKGTEACRDHMTKTRVDPFPDIPLPIGCEPTMEESCGPGKTFPSGLVCTFNGVEIPTLCQWSEHGGMTGKILVNIFKELDRRKIVDRSDGVLPFVLLDGHQSRFSVEFLLYINNPNHKWVDCIILPYGTHLWQLADNKRINGIYTNAFSLEK